MKTIQTVAMKSAYSHSRYPKVELITNGEFKSPISPVVLCHGLFGYSEKQIATLQLQYWRGIKDVLLHRGCEVYSTGVGSISSVKERAVNLHKFLEQNFRGKEINLVAHSMGGLDCRYLISHIPNRSYKILSVSTIATPHRGSSFMDWVRDKVGVGHLSQYIRRETEDVVVSSCDFMEKNILKSQHTTLQRIIQPFDALAFTNLTRDYCRAFNSITHDDPEVYYSSYAASENMGILSRLAFPFHIVRKSEGENDGFVSVESAKWGNFRGVIGCDHWDLVPAKVPRLGNSFSQTDFYLTLITHLASKGY